MKQKGLAPLVIIILIALAVGGFLIYQKQFKPAVPQPSLNPVANPVPNGTGETANPDSIGANWKTYNSEGKFSFKYPQNYYLTVTKEDVYLTSSLIYENQMLPEKLIWISIKNNSPQNSDHYQQLFEKLYSAVANSVVSSGEAGVLTKLNNQELDGFQMVEYIQDTTHISGDYVKYNHIFLIKKSSTQVLKISNESARKEDTNAVDPLFKQILSTFKFLP